MSANYSILRNHSNELTHIVALRCCASHGVAQLLTLLRPVAGEFQLGIKYNLINTHMGHGQGDHFGEQVNDIKP